LQPDRSALHANRSANRLVDVQSLSAICGMTKTKKPLNETHSASQTTRATLLLREMIVDGHFRPGERIREIPLAAKLRVSRIPLRLALERLANEGLLEIRPTRGFIVQQFSSGDIYDAIDLRGLLEGSAARMASERLRDAGDLATLRAANLEMEALLHRRKMTLVVFTRYIGLNARFHAGIIDLAHSRIIRRALNQACALPFASPSAFLLKQQFIESSRELFLVAVDHHRGIIDAIASREGMRAETLMREHARLARRHLNVALSDRELLRSVPGGKLIELLTS
jgi:GntR family transcriptional regulator, vanillate catabolism transcriptional regulator